MSGSKFAVVIHVHDDHWYLGPTIDCWAQAGPVFCFISSKAWDGTVGSWQSSEQIALESGATVVIGEWSSEDEQREAGYNHLRELGFLYALTPDGDELVEPKLLAAVKDTLESGSADRVHVRCETYWKSPEFVVRPREHFSPQVGVNLQTTRHHHCREASGGQSVLLSEEQYGLLHHLSYAGPDERIRRKIQTWPHRHEVVDGWWSRIWKTWDLNPTLKLVHPTHPPAYDHIEPITCPNVLRNCLGIDGRNLRHELSVPQLGSSVAIVIPLYGGEQEIRNCLDSLGTCQDCFSRVVVVDNHSPDNAAQVCKEFDFVELIQLDENLGFAGACNLGASKCTEQVLVFLNSDTVVTRPGLAHLVNAIEENELVAAAGPYTNCAASQQQIDAPYSSLDQIEPFSNHFSSLNWPDQSTDLLIGFCLAVRKTVFEQIGGFDTSFQIGMFEDNDLCYRLKRLGYQLRIAGKSYIHHEGSKSFQRSHVRMSEVFRKNREVFFRKWSKDLDSGFASHLPESGARPVVFDQTRRPENAQRRIDDLRYLSNISLCMIVRNEERVIADCLESAKPFFSQIVVIDTGSTDNTVEIARGCGAEVHEVQWPYSFSVARNESLKYATGDWIMWMDADDTLPINSGMAIMNAVIHAPSLITAFVVPVQFVDEGESSGTRVDHVKVFRNFRGIHFEGRIHEQNLPSIRAIGGEVARIDAVVLHSGYDTSEQGQKKKAERDRTLLGLDFSERPKHPFVLFNLGMTRHYGGMHREAVGWLKRSIRYAESSDSHIPKAFVLMANSQRALGKLAEAEKTLREGITLSHNDPEIRFTLASLLASTGRKHEAITLYDSVLKQNTSNQFSSVDIGILGFKTLHNMASLVLELGDWPSAKSIWMQALASAPKQFGVANHIFSEAMSRTDWVTAQQAMEHVRFHEPELRLWVSMLIQYVEVTQGAAAILDSLRRAFQSYGSSEAVHLAFGRQLAIDGKDEEAKQHLEMLASQSNAEAAFYLGILYLRANDLELALRWTELASELNPNHSGTQEQLSNLRLAIGVENF